MQAVLCKHILNQPEDCFSDNTTHVCTVQVKNIIQQMYCGFIIFAGHLDSSLEKTRNEIQIYTEETLNQQKHKASEVSKKYC